MSLNNFEYYKLKMKELIKLSAAAVLFLTIADAQIIEQDNRRYLAANSTEDADPDAEEPVDDSDTTDQTDDDYPVETEEEKEERLAKEQIEQDQ